MGFNGPSDIERVAGREMEVIEYFQNGQAKAYPGDRKIRAGINEFVKAGREAGRTLMIFLQRLSFIASHWHCQWIPVRG